jgi:uncharacterized membrane protein YhdT
MPDSTGAPARPAPFTAPEPAPALAPIPAKRGRFAQANKEALLTLGLYLAYFVWWYGFAYGLGGGDPAGYSYVLGFPAWFFYSCIAGFPLLTLALWLLVRLCFRDLPLDACADGDASAHPSAPSSNSL